MAEFTSTSSASLSTSSSDTTIITEELIVPLLEALVRVNYKWEEIGTALRLPDHIIRQCEHKNNTLALKNILIEWVHKNGLPAKLGNLQWALSSSIVGESSFAQSIFKLPNECEESSSSESSSLSHETRLLKAMYSKQKEVPTDHWPPVGIDTCINLALINSLRSKINRDYDYSVRGDPDDILHEKTMVEYKDIFGEHAAGKIILVEGRPGSGKTTLVSKISKDWATDESFLVNAKMLFLVPLRSFDKTSSHSLSNVLRLFKLKPQVINNIEAELGKGSCFVLDGLDEYNPCNREESAVLSLINKKILPECMVIVTSRPVATAEMRKSACIYKTIEVLGFKGEQIYEYIGRYPFDNTSNKSTLKSYLDLHSNIFHMCYLPVHSAMICFLYDKCGRIPETETKVYEEFIRLIVSRNNMRCNKPSHIDALDVISEEHREQFSKICKLAFEMTVQSKQLIRENDTEVSILSSGELGDESTLGLLTVDKALTLYNVINTYSFLHLTLQEFLAAYHISHLDEDQQVKIFREHLAELRMTYVIVFYCGMTKFRQNDPRLKIVEYSPNVMRSAFESQQSIVCDLALKEKKIFDMDIYLTSRGMIERAYIVSQASVKIFHITWDNCALTAEKFFFFFGKVNNSKLQNLNCINLPYNNLSSEDCSKIIKALQSVHELNRLWIPGNNIGIPAAEHIGSLVGLKVLNIVKCSIDSKTAHTLLKALKTTKIETLNLSHNLIGYDGNDTWDELKYLTDLKALLVDNNWINVHSLTRVLENTKLTSLELLSNFRQVRIVAFSLLLQLQCIHFSGSKFSNNPLDIAPLSNSNLKILTLCNCNLNNHQSAKLLQALRHCINIEKLDLSRNVIATIGMPYLCDGVTVWKELITLYLTETCIDTEGSKSLAEVIGNCKKMTYFDISHNSINSTGALALVNGLKACTQLKYFGIIGNSVDEVTLKTIEEDMKARQCALYREVKLHSNDFIYRSYNISLIEEVVPI